MIHFFSFLSSFLIYLFIRGVLGTYFKGHHLREFLTDTVYGYVSILICEGVHDSMSIHAASSATVYLPRASYPK